MLLPISAVPQIAVYNLTVSENVGTAFITFNRTRGDLTTNSRVFAQTRSIEGNVAAAIQ